MADKLICCVMFGGWFQIAGLWE